MGKNMQNNSPKIVKPIDKPQHISLLIPTRGRPEYLDKVFDSIGRTVGNADGIDVWIYVDNDDDITKEYIHSKSYLRYPFKINWVFGERNISQGQMVNILRQKCATNPGMYMPFADDYVLTTGDWDGAIRDAFDRYPDRIVLGYVPNPHSGPEQVTLPVLSAEWTNITGRILTESFPCWCDDTWLDQVSQLVQRKTRIDIRVESIAGMGKTPRLKNLPFWHSYFTNLMDERLKEANLLLKAIYPQDCPEYQQSVKEAERLAKSLTEKREKVTKDYLLALEREHSSFPENPEPHLILLHLALEAKAVSCLCDKADSLIQACDFGKALKMLDNVVLAEREYKNINGLRAVCVERLERAGETSQPPPAEPMLQPEHGDARQLPAPTEEPRFSFVMIVLNGMPFIEYSLKSVYEFAHEIIIVEGAVQKCMFAANPDGSSTDGTVEFIESFPDPQNKIKLIQGKWPEKCEMQDEALKYVEGDYVWLIDSDEVYKTEDLERVKTLVRSDPSITQVNFNGDNFWKGLDYIFVSPKFFESGAHWRRVFKFVRGATFTIHRPPTMVWPGSELTTEQMHLVDGHKTRGMGIIPCHYSYVLDKQVRQKIELYSRYGWGKDWNIDLREWYNECFLKWTPENRQEIDSKYPIWTGDRNSRTQLFTGTHPEVMKNFKNKLVQKHCCSEEQALQVIGDTYYQKKVVEAWNLIEIDEPVIKRKDLMTQNIQQNKPFWNIHVALAFLADRLNLENYLEVGVRTGCSLVPLLHNSDVKEVVVLDMWKGSYAGFSNTKEYTVEQINKYKAKTNKQAKIEFIKGDSHKKLKDLISLGRNFDLITVDGDHSESGAWEDLQDATKLLADKGAIVFDDIIHPSYSYLKKLVDRFQQEHSEYAVLINSKQDNGCVILLKNIDPTSLLNEKPSEVSDKATKGVKVAADYVQTGIKVGAESSFGAKIQELFSKIRPRKIIETGTYLGTGTTTIITRSLQKLGIDDAMFFTIEVNPQNYARAKQYFETNNMKVNALNGLSVPRAMLPSREEIARKTITDVDYDGIFVDHKEETRAELYYNETNFPNLPDNLLYKCLKLFDFKPDFVLLDSGGHMGNIEFNYLIDNLQGECYIALDDIYHVKHHHSFKQAQSDPRFEIVTASKEKFGFCIAKFTPTQVDQKVVDDSQIIISSNVKKKKKVLIVRTDSIGDFVIFSGSLPYYRKLYPDSHISIAVRECSTELAEACPYIDEVIVNHREPMVYDQNYAAEFIKRIRASKFDIAICPIYSRDKVSDFITANSRAGERIVSAGNDSNMPLEQIQANNPYFTSIIPARAGIISEVERNKEFLEGLGVVINQPYETTVWIEQEHRDFANRLLKELNIEKPIVVCPFAQHQIRDWPVHKWAQLISHCGDYPVVICGADRDKQEAEELITLTNHRNIHNLCGKTTLRQLAAVLANSELCLGVESASAHIAAAVDRPHVVIIGGGHFGRFMPYSPKTTLVYNKMDCYGCNWRCKYGRDIRCIKAITVDMVEQAVNGWLKKAAEPFTQDQKTSYKQPQKEQYLVSAIISTYNSEKFIRGCLEDLENQTIAEKLEIIVVNSGSKQNEEAIVRKFQRKYDNIVYIKTDQRETVYAAWNRAVKVAHGRFLTNANTDDRHRKDALEIMSRTLQANPDIALVYGDQRYTDTPNGTFANHHSTQIAKRPEYSRERLLLGCCVGSQPMWRKSLHSEFGYFDETLTCAGDWDFWLRISSKYKFKHIPEFLGLYYYNENGIEHGRKIHSLYERYIVGKRYGTPYISVIPLYTNQSNPLVSIIMPAYNAAEYIAEAIESVLIQNYRNFELIIVDDGSIDNTRDIIAGFKDEKIKYFYKENAGAASARNLGIKKSQGAFLIHLDSDDMITPDFIAKHLQQFEKHPEADLVYCDDYLIDENEKPIRVIERSEYPDQKSLIRDLFRSGFPVVPFRTCIRRSVFDKIGFFDEDLLIGEDYDMMRRFAKSGLKIHHLKGALYLRRMTSDSLSRNYSAQKAKCHFDVLKRFTDTFAYDELFPNVAWDKISAQMRQLHAKCLAAVTYLAIGQDYVKSNSPPIYAKMAFRQACSELNDCLKIDPNNQQIQQLLQKCEFGEQKYDEQIQQAVC
jgi:glycosyltransferase involved in cell wall biosynthesis/ADP-heptose:LPS heptosyltransferase